MGKAKLPPGFVYDRPVPQRWADDLARLTPVSEIHPWLLLAWLPGDPWEPIQRWSVYEMVPLRVWWGIIQGHRAQGKSDADIIECLILEELNAANPRDRGHYDAVLKRFVSEALVTRQEWELHRAHKCVPKLFWIIQGDRGGHKRHFSQLEQKYLAAARLPTDPPVPGDLPYAEFDQRVIHQLAQRDRLHGCHGKIATEADYVEFRRELVAWLEEQIRADLESVKLDLDGIPRSGAKEDDPTEEIERAIDHFIQTGSTDPLPES